MVTAVALRWSLVATRLGLCARVFAVIFLCRSFLWAALQQYEGKPISAIRFDPSLQPLSDQTLIGLLPIKVGEPLREAGLRAAIQRLYATGEYKDIAVDATLEPEGVALRFITTPNYFVGGILAEGVPEPPSRGQMVTSTKLVLGSEYAESDSSQAVEGLDEVLRRNGFYEPQINSSIERDPTTHQVRLLFRIDPGQRAKFHGVNVTGDPQRPLQAIINSTGWKPWRGFLPWRSLTESRLQTGLDNIRNWYQKNNRLLAHVTLVRLEFDAETSRVTPTINIEAGPKVKVKVVGANISGGRLRSLLPIYAERSVDRELLMEGQKNLVNYMRSRGYFEAVASFTTELQPGGDEAIEYDVQKKGRHKLVFLSIEGNHYFDRATLRERMYLLPATFLRYRWGRYSPEYLQKDLNSIRDLYRSNGFRDVEVTSREVDNYKGKPNQIALFVNIKEGPQWFVTKLEFQGISKTDQERLRTLTALH